jgi:hypothetical protein
MTAVQAISEVLTTEEACKLPSSADLAVAALLARCSNRTFEAYRHDLRTHFQWAAEAGLQVFAATRGHIELYRATLEERGLAPSTIDRRLSTVCGFYRFAHIDGRIGSNPAQYVRRPRIFANEVRGMASAAKARSFAGGMANAWTVGLRTAGFVPSGSELGLATSTRTCSDRPSSWRRSMPAYHFVMSSLPLVTKIREPRPSTTGNGPTSTAMLPMSSLPLSPADSRHRPRSPGL